MGLAFTEVLDPLEGLEKMKIQTFKNDGFTEGDVSMTFVVMYNPVSYFSEVKNKYEKVTVEGAKPVYNFKRIEDESLSIELLLDATGASVNEDLKPPTSGAGEIVDLSKVSTEKGNTEFAINQFLNETKRIVDEEHQPRYIKVLWGELAFEGIMETAKVTHTLFNKDGKPIRSKLGLTFKKHQSLKEQAAELKKKSSDLTHIRQVKEEDTLPLLSFDKYKDPSLYLQLAQVNRLNNFRSLTNGSRLRLPPLEK